MKNAKKSMFITTILMVAVLIVAVSTATFAWYTASSTANASNATLVAAKSDAANVAVGWTNSADTTSIVFDSNSTTVSPMAPAAAPTIGMDYADLKLYTATLDSTGKFNENGSEITPWTVKQNEGTATSFFVINYNKNAAVNVTMTIEYLNEVEDNLETPENEAKQWENNDKLVVAVFVGGKLAGVFSDDAYAAATITKGNAAADLAPTTGAEIKTSIVIPLDAAPASGGTFAEITVKAWLDGAELTQDYAEGKAAFTFNFSAATAE